MSNTSSWGRVLRRVDTPPSPPTARQAANDHWDRLMALRPNDMTLDDLAEHVKGRRLLVEQVTAELEQRVRDWEEAEQAFVERVRPELKRHQIVALDPHEEDVDLSQGPSE